MNVSRLPPCPTTGCVAATASLARCSSLPFVYSRSADDQAKRLDGVAQVQESLPSLLGGACLNAVAEFTCLGANLSCSFGAPLPLPCKSACETVHSSCGWLVMTFGVRPNAPGGLFDCETYPNGQWPECASPIDDAWLPSSGCHPMDPTLTLPNTLTLPLPEPCP